MKAVFTTWCTNDYTEMIGLKELTNQLKYFHPNVPHIIINSEKENELKDKYPWALPQHMMPISMIEYFDDYDTVIHIDGDSTVTGELEHIFDTSYDVMCVRNYTLIGQCGFTPPEKCVVPAGFNTNNFMNAGFVVINSKEFVGEWLNNCSKLNRNDDEQNELNRIFNSGKYKGKILDDFNTGLSYGMTNVWGNETHWDSWKNLFIEDDKLKQINQLGEKINVKILHMAGGGDSKKEVFKGKKMREWLSEWVSPEVSNYLNKISVG